MNQFLQQLCLYQPGVRETLGLPDKVDPVPPAIHEKIVTPGEKQGDLLRKQQIITLSPRELLAVSPLDMNLMFGVNFKIAFFGHSNIHVSYLELLTVIC